MIDIESLLSSVSDEDMAKIKNIAQSLMEKDEKDTPKTASTPDTIPNLPIDSDMMKKIMSLMGQMNKENYRTRLIQDLKPMLSNERQQKADEAIRFLQLMEVLPLIRGIF